MDDKPRGPGLSHLVLLAVVIAVGWYFVRPLGEEIRDILQSVVDAFNNNR